MAHHHLDKPLGDGAMPDKGQGPGVSVRQVSGARRDPAVLQASRRSRWGAAQH